MKQLSKTKIIVVLGILFSSIVFAQEKMTNQSVISLRNAGLSEEIIRTKIHTSSGVDFDMSTDAILELKKQGISDGTISMMIEKSESSKKGLDGNMMMINSIEEKDGVLVLNNHIEIKRGDLIQIFLPVFGHKDFQYVYRKKSGITAGLVAGIAGAVGMGTMALGVAGGSLGAVKTGLQVTAIGYGADAVGQIQNLKISKSAKKIAGKKMEVLSWGADDGGYVILAKFGKKKYNIVIREAIMTGEIKL